MMFGLSLFMKEALQEATKGFDEEKFPWVP